MYTVKRAAELTGIAPDTLRVWERRYGVVAPLRSEGGYRLYDDSALRRLAAMKTLIDSGWGAAQAARHVLDGIARVDGAFTASRWMLSWATSPPWRALPATSTPQRSTRPSTKRSPRGRSNRSWTHWLMPSLVHLGNAWRGGSVTVAGEHFVSATVQRRLAALFDAAGSSLPDPTVVVGLARGSRHEIGVLAFATALRRAGPGVVYVGGDLPPEEWVATIDSRSAAAAVLGVPSPEDVPAVRETVTMLAAAHPTLHIYVGGSHQSAVGGPAHTLGHAIGPAARQLTDSLHADPDS